MYYIYIYIHIYIYVYINIGLTRILNALSHHRWAWADLDVVFGDLLYYLHAATLHPACCHGQELVCTKKLRLDRTSICYDSSRKKVAADVWADPTACPCTGS